jgi:hypothetical protein
LRSVHRAASAAVRTGKATITKIEVNRTFHVKIGIRNIVMPGARSAKIVVMKLTAPRIVPTPDRISPAIHMSPPVSGENGIKLSGVYDVQPKLAAP